MSIAAREVPAPAPNGDLSSVRATARKTAELTACKQTLEWVDAVLAGRLRQNSLERYREILAELPGNSAIDAMYANASPSSISGADAALIAQALIDAGAEEKARELLVRTFARLNSVGRKWDYANATGCRLLGDLCRRAGDVDTAELWYRAALRCYPLYRAALIACAELCIERNPEDALDMMYRAHLMLDLPPTHYRLEDRSVMIINHGAGWVIILYRGLYIGLRGAYLPYHITAAYAEEVLAARDGKVAAPKSRRLRWLRQIVSAPAFETKVDHDYLAILHAVSG